MTEKIDEALRMLGYLDDAIKEHPYDCTCQVGGVDAMSVDTDWLRHIAQTTRTALLAAYPLEDPR